MSGKESRPGPRKDHRVRMLKPKHHDTYLRKGKSAKVTVCDGCGAMNQAGRWSWAEPPSTEVKGGLCPACARIRDRYPVGTIRLPAAFLTRREELLGMIRNVEEAEKAEHPLERLMDIRDEPDGGLLVTTTGIHLARALAHKLERCLHRQARIRYPEEENLVFVDWK